jgi:hypothetical protein
METKICSKCKEEKEVCEFNKDSVRKDGLRGECKSCRKIIKKKYYDENQIKILEKKKNFYENNKEYLKQKSLEYHYNNVKKIKERKKQYYQNNKYKFNEYNKIKYQTNVLYKIGKLARRRVYDYIFKNNIKIEKTFDIVGCTPEFLKEHLETQFKNGMSWENQGQWHIDHIIPLSSAKTEEEVYQLCYYTNLQPLWAKDNQSKGNKILT